MISVLLLAHTLRVLTGLEPGPSAEEAEIRPTEVAYLEATWGETVIRGRPWVPHRRVATVSDGTRLVVRGVVDSRDDKGCRGEPWYAVYPFGFVCSKHVRATDRPPEPGTALPLEPGRRLPHTYVYVRSDGVPLYAGYADVDAGVPTRPLTKGMSLVVHRTLEYDGLEWIQTPEGALVPKEGVRFGGQGSEWAGVSLKGHHSGPSFAWTKRRKGTPVRGAPDSKAERRLELELRTRVPLLESRPGPGDKLWWRVGDELWIDGDHLNEVHIVAAAPPDVLDEWRRRNVGNDQWIDVDLGEQTLVAYRGGRAVFATMVSSGRSTATPRGNYPVWAKVASMTMANQAYEDKPYMVQGVPWVLLFQGHNALHGAYWHDRFGNKKSHGCVNLAPHDARWMFEWTGPRLPRGWTGYLPSDLRRSPVVHVRDSSLAASDIQAGPQYDPAFVPGGVVPPLPSVEEGVEDGPLEDGADERPNDASAAEAPRLEPRSAPPSLGAGGV